MRKQLITALATVLTSSMIAIPAEAGNANWDTGGYVPPTPSEVGRTVVEETYDDAGSIEDNKPLMDAYGGYDKYLASFEVVTPEYFKQKYAEVAELLQPNIDTSSQLSIWYSAIAAVDGHFTRTFSELGEVGTYHSYNQRANTDYVADGIAGSGYEPATLLHTILTRNGVTNAVYRSTANGWTHYVKASVDGKDCYAESNTFEVKVVADVPSDMDKESLSEILMGAYAQYFN
ncbi:hypothetical protein [Clostridium sp.]|uniref:hypothetical protein n=1 Tax=Clostridium sp. TaxID=1506 RepID=UPI002588A73D|nr:hypothetical protein [Clostridium sp.]MCI6138428.1 hypothetical protein [Clostridium sp.]